MVPLPPFLYNNLSQQLQLISSELGVMVIRWFGISVYLEGNVIDLGVYKLQVVEACNGLRFLFPLMSFGFLAAYMFYAPFWQRALVFLSTMPITVLMNSFRIVCRQADDGNLDIVAIGPRRHIYEETYRRVRKG